MCKWFDDLINKFVKCEICVDSIFAFKTNSYNKTDLKYIMQYTLIKRRFNAACTLPTHCMHTACTLHTCC